jgi:hypothetical protein
MLKQESFGFCWVGSCRTGQSKFQQFSLPGRQVSVLAVALIWVGK